MIDTDSQSHATLVTTGRTNHGVDNSLYAVLTAERANAAHTLATCIVPSTWHADLHVLPASPLLEGAERELMREKVAKLMGQPLEKMSDAQWIGHILKRLHLWTRQDGSGGWMGSPMRLGRSTYLI